MSRINGFIGRRDFWKLLGIKGLTITTTAAVASQLSAQPASFADVHPVDPNPISPNEALKLLLDGNQRFVEQTRKYPDQSLERMRIVALGQHPFASILGCADSRVPAEIVFDRGLGDLFVVRVAGNVASDTAIGSLEYSASILGCPLIVVLGHRKCGAVAEALDDKPLPGRIGLIVERIKPAMERIISRDGDTWENMVKANIQYQVEKLLERSSILAKRVQDGKLKIVGARYDIDTGRVLLII